MTTTENTYEISFTDFDVDRGKYPHGKREVVGRQSARNGIAAIKALLTAKFDGDAELLAELENAHTIGSNKRLVLQGITFVANKARA